MRIAGFLGTDFQDDERGLCSMIYLARCNYRCPSCHSKKIVEGEPVYSKNEVLERLERKKPYIKRVAITGGEPTLQADLPDFLRRLREIGISVKLDTNGSRFGVLQELHKEKLVDYVAMDIKGPFSLYWKLTGMEYVDERDDLLKGMCIVQRFPDYEYRHTCVPLFEDGRLRWMTREEIEEMARYVVDNTQNDSHRFYVQRFVAREKDEMLDERFAKENLPQEYWETPARVIDEIYEAIKKYLPNARIR